MLHLSPGATGEYYSAEGADLVAVTAPPYRRALREAGHGADLDNLAVDPMPDGVATTAVHAGGKFLKRLAAGLSAGHGPIETGR